MNAAGSPNDVTARAYDIVYEPYMTIQKTHQEVEFTLSQVTSKTPLLDVGCGTGRHVVELALRNRDVTGIDCSSEMLKVLQKKLEAKKLHANLVCRDIKTVDSFGKKFGGIICFWNAICEIARDNEEASKLFSLFYQSLRINGKLIVDISELTTFNLRSFKYEWNTEAEGRQYHVIFKTIDYDEEERTTISTEVVEIKEGNTLEKLEAQIKQKWWTKNEVDAFCRNSGFSSIQFFGADFHPWKRPSDKIFVVATK